MVILWDLRHLQLVIQYLMTILKRFILKLIIQLHLAEIQMFGKSSIFNNLTGMHQHTGNWTRKNSIK